MNSSRGGAEFGADGAHDLFAAGEDRVVENAAPVFGYEDHVDVQGGHVVSGALVVGHVGGGSYGGGVQLRYRFRIEPSSAQRGMLERTFGCCRVVFNDALARRNADHAAGLPALSRSALQKAVIIDAKRTPERAWLGEVSNVALVQAHNDLPVAYSNFFASVKDKRGGRRIGFPRFRSRHDNRQTARFTRNGFTVRPNGRLFLAKIGDVKVR